MREIVVRARLRDLDEVLDRVLPIVPGGAHQAPAGEGEVELRMRGPELPPVAEIASALASLTDAVSEHDVSDDWRERRLGDYRAAPIGGRRGVPPPGGRPPPGGHHAVVLAEGGAFGEGTHPTTQGCVELLLDLQPAGSFADLGCGTGVLAIVAATLGWNPVIALDAQTSSVEVARENARRNGVNVGASAADLLAEAPPAADGFAANVPPLVHRAIATGWGERAPAVGLVSGFGPDQREEVLDEYALCGLRPSRQLERFGWTVAEVRRG
jgi:ribosomal protein L11 methyltransferase